MIAAVAAPSRQPAQGDREEKDQHQAEPERRNRQSRHRHGRRQQIEGRAGLRRGDDPGQSPNHDRQRHADHRQADRVPIALGQNFQDWRAGAQRLTEIATQRRGNPTPILHRQRLVQPEAGVQICQILGGGRGGGHHPHRIAGREVEEQKDGQRRKHDHRDRLHHAFNDVSPHRSLPRVRSAGLGGAPCPAEADDLGRQHLDPLHAGRVPHHLLLEVTENPGRCFEDEGR